MKRFFNLNDLVTILVLGFILASCGGAAGGSGDAGSNSDDNNSSTTAVQAARSFLITGDVTSAKTEYDTALTADTTNTSAAFGAALTRLLLISESTPVQSALQSLGQDPFSLSNITGSSGYLAELDDYNATSTELDSQADTHPSLSDSVPFLGEGSFFSRILSHAVAGLVPTQLQTNASDLVPLFQEIDDLLAQADTSNDFQFVVPQELYYGTTDITLNRIDLKNLRAAIDFTLMGLYLQNSWECEIDIGSFYNEDQQMIVSNQTIVDSLNECLGLKTDNEIDEAQLEFAQGLQNLLDAQDLLPSVSTDGIVENTTLTQSGYAEFEQIIINVQNSLSSDQTLTFLGPIVTINAGNFFASPPSAADIDFDPFVVEHGQIRLVEAFFEQALSGTIDMTFAQSYRNVFIALNHDFFNAAFDEFANFRLAGHRFTNAD